MRLQAALDRQDHAATIGAAKELVEAACKITIERTGQDVPERASLPALFKQAQLAVGYGADGSGDPLARSLTTSVQSLAELRNAVGTGHGRDFLLSTT
jgi:hypothetical protein